MNVSGLNRESYELKRLSVTKIDKNAPNDMLERQP